MAGLYDRLSGWYEWLASSEHPLVERGLSRLAVRPGERVLDLGPGPGYALAALARAAHLGGWACGLDRSAGMLRAAQARLRRTHSEAGLVQGDALRLPYAPGSFDALFLSFTLELFDDEALPEVLQECRRVLRAGGRLGLVTLLDVSHPGFMSRAYGWCHRHFPRLVDCHPIEPLGWLERSGFALISSEEASLWGLPVAIILAKPDGIPE